MVFETHYGGRIIQFRLERRKVKYLVIRVHPVGLVEVIAPSDADADEVRCRVGRRGRWVLKQQRQFARMLGLPEVRRHRSGESIRYLGRQYRLRIRQDNKEGIRLTRGCLEVATRPQARTDRPARLIAGWLVGQAKQKLAERFQRCAKLAENFGIKGGRYSLRRMARRWGSCSKQGRVLLNPALVAASVDCIDYVIIHELCHLRYHHHRPEFYKLLSRMLPDWKRRKAKLEISLA